MPLSVKIILVLCTVAFFSAFLFLLKKGAIKPFYSALWLLVALLMLSLVVFEKVYKSIANWLGIRDASFLVLVAVIFFLLLYVMHLSVKASELSDRVQELISHVAILDLKLRDSAQVAAPDPPPPKRQESQLPAPSETSHDRG